MKTKITLTSYYHGAGILATWHAGTGRELATITEPGSLNWTGDPMKFDGTTRTRIMMFSAGIAHYYNSPDIMERAQAYSY